jgi:hypothetical protein
MLVAALTCLGNPSIFAPQDAERQELIGLPANCFRIPASGIDLVDSHRRENGIRKKSAYEKYGKINCMILMKVDNMGPAFV